jgi:hypothetical protein
MARATEAGIDLRENHPPPRNHLSNPWSAIVVSAPAAGVIGVATGSWGSFASPRSPRRARPKGQPWDASGTPAYPDAGRDSAERGTGRKLTAAYSLLGK